MLLLLSDRVIFMGYIKRHYQYNNFDDEKVSLRLEGERL